MHRLFVALPLPGDIADSLLDLMDGPERLRWSPAEQLHLTLRFIGEVDGDTAEDVAAALSSLRFEPFELRLKDVGQFHHKRSGALWAGIEPREPVATLAARIDRAVASAGLAPETRAFVPHVRLARWSGPAPDLQPWLSRHGTLTSPPWTVRGFTLLESHLGRHGAHHEPMATFGAA
ncbi:RNA 2',3'-cyclic phosphodiesterase [Sphingomonas sp. LHG3443-2]|uniref:RNA 2',3'-cyclic phosphodiesterase n=1 Tax=Sphingomonas sp. LHG3443-2 TaxID=2804639 RepID=UPI003CEF8FD2